MTITKPLTDIRDACERLRRLPIARWQQPPRTPLGSVSVESRVGHGDPLETQAIALVHRLIAFDAESRRLPVANPNVPGPGLPDVILVLAMSIADRADDGSAPLLDETARLLRSWC